MFAFAFGLAHRAADGTVLDVFFPAPVRAPDAALASAVGTAIGDDASATHEIDDGVLARLAAALGAAGRADLAAAARGCIGARTMKVLTVLREDEPIGSTGEAYLKLHLLSHRLALPNSLDLDGIFAALPNVAWTSDGPVALDELPAARLRARAAGRPLTVQSVDKFPRMVDYVVPAGVRIADASRIRLGAYLGEGTTVMHEGFVNFNAGTLGAGMVEGRISQGVVVGADSDLGGSSSTMGTLSGGGNERISIGERCLIGANAGTGISLGDRCTIEAGLYVTAGTPVRVLDEAGADAGEVKARELSGRSDLLFVRNARTGVVECRTNRSAIELNEALHAHN
ncbi:MAG: DapH/DapD/GlmU-related protein [Pseudomonadales bacterium]|jgi:2,3,4,5-tetrahydropyridine-2-carboxylate N-succinyltransferase|nr:DapH/DapD/GlmU-related protein [Pseudomonadales bacterium]